MGTAAPGWWTEAREHRSEGLVLLRPCTASLRSLRPGRDPLTSLSLFSHLLRGTRTFAQLALRGWRGSDASHNSVPRASAWARCGTDVFRTVLCNVKARGAVRQVYCCKL